MSMWCGDGDPVQFSNTTLRKSRKEHRCCACKQTIWVGETYAVHKECFGDHVWTYKRCGSCQIVYAHLCAMATRNEDGFGGGEEWPDPELNCGHEWSDLHEQPLPEHLAATAFWTPDERSAALRDTAQS